MNELTVVTACTHQPPQDYYCLNSYIKSLRNHPLFLMNTTFGKWGGLLTKCKWLYSAIANKMFESKYILFTDCWDFVYVDTPEIILEKFKAFNTSIVMGAEKSCWPPDYKEAFDEASNFSTSFNYGNTGLLIGETEAFREVFNWCNVLEMDDDYQREDGTAFHSNDQLLFQYLFSEDIVPMKLDYTCTLVQNMQDVEEKELEFVHGRIKNIETGQMPSSIHWNGSSKDKWSMPIILEHLNLV